jgi:pSer/pThr/pTyr-binding forkhead associated (FHA) protein
MAVTVVVLSGAEPSPDLSLTLDAPRLVIGRGEGCDVRLPDPSVSHRHASIRQRGGEHVLLDENSTNGTFMDRVRLPPQTPRALRSGERVRLGRVWLEVRFEPAVVKGSTAAAAKELALGLVARGLAAQGEEPGPILTVLSGPDAGATLVLGEVGRTYTLGRSPDADLRLDEPGAGRRHATVARKGDGLTVVDGGAPSGTYLDDRPIQEATWKPGQVLSIGGTHVGLEHPAAEALAELEQSPDERMPDGEVPEPTSAPPPAPDASTDPSSSPEEEGTPDATPAPGDAAPVPRTRSKAEPGGWGAADSVVVLLALGVLALSALGAFFLLGR